MIDVDEFIKARERLPLSRESWSELTLTIVHDDRLTASVMYTPELRDWLRNHGYPPPVDCSCNSNHNGPPRFCGDKRPACSLGICKRAVILAGDW
jgi:hypothetical protein